MRHSAKTTICAMVVSCLAGVFANASATADVFDFSFGPGVNGTFTTGALSPTDPGYDLITGLTFNLLSGATEVGAPFSFTDEVASVFQPGAAFNPTTAAFVNHFGGASVPNIGFFFVPDANVSGASFSQGSNLLSGTLPSHDGYSVSAPLVITEATVPEPSTWAMMLIGFAGLTFAGYKRARGRGAAAWGNALA
jgi:hypothetical protein